MSAEEKWERVIIIKEPNEPEAVPVTPIEDMEQYKIGILEIETKQDFGCHKGERICYSPFTDDNGYTLQICDMNPKKKLTAGDLKDGTLLKSVISEFNKDRNKGTLLNVMQILRDSYVWIPCSAVMSEADQKRMQELIDSCNGDYDKMVGLEFTAKDETRLIPDILQGGDDYYFPVFSSAEEMGEYGKNFSKVEKSFLEALVIAKNNDKKLAGIVVNAYTEPFELKAELWELMEKMRSCLSE